MAGSADSLDFALARLDADGSLDESFGNAGKVITDFFSNTDRATDVAIEKSGRIVAAGASIEFAGPAFFALARYKRDGSLDEGFGDGGRVLSELGESSTGASVAIQGNGKIVVAGRVVGDPDLQNPLHCISDGVELGLSRVT